MTTARDDDDGGRGKWYARNVAKREAAPRCKAIDLSADTIARSPLDRVRRVVFDSVCICFDMYSWYVYDMHHHLPHHRAYIIFECKFTREYSRKSIWYAIGARNDNQRAVRILFVVLIIV